MKCEKCDVEANPNFGSGRFCSKKCANSRTFSKELKQKISATLKKKGALRPPLEGDALERWKASMKQSWDNKYKAKGFDELSIWQKRRRVVEEQNNCCADCGLSQWKGSPIALEMDHKDGNTDNNNRDNLWAVCPNCHSTTETWRGKNKPRYNGEKKVSDTDLIKALQTETSIRRALLSVGLAAKGHNYERAKQLKGT